MSTVVKDLGAVSAYAYAVEKGYTGTEAEFAELMASYAEVGQTAANAAESALNSKTAAQTAATTATNKANEATTAAQTATTKAGEASQSASNANTAKEEAAMAKTAAETAQGKAEDAQAAAESVAESIPSDYSQLSEDVSDLKEGLTSLADTNVNLFDKDSEDTVTGAFLRNGSPVSGDRYLYTNYFPIKPGETVITKYSINLGTSQLALYNSSKTYINKVSGVKSGDYVTYTVPATTYYLSAVYGRVNNEVVNMSTLMVVKGSTYPSDYKPFGQVILNPPVPLTSTQKLEVQDMIDAGEYINLPNVLYQKKVVFDGDSICAGVSAGDERSGWAGIIGTANSMDWHNEGATGATITYISGRHCISRNIDSIYASYPTLDYLILEGGCNDADLLYKTELPFGTLSLSDYNSTFDDATFTGALESLFQNAVNKYPTTKIGFIITQKMGTSYAGYDADHSRYRAFYERIIEVCKKWGIPYLDLWTICPLNPRMPAMYSSQMTPQENIDAGHAYIDGQHLTPTGYDVISPCIEAWMRTL